MSIFSDYRVGAIDDREFRNECIRMNREEREYIDDLERHMDEDLVIDNDDEYPMGYNPYQE